MPIYQGPTYSAVPVNDELLPLNARANARWLTEIHESAAELKPAWDHVAAQQTEYNFMQEDEWVGAADQVGADIDSGAIDPHDLKLKSLLAEYELAEVHAHAEREKVLAQADAYRVAVHRLTGALSRKKRRGFENKKTADQGEIDKINARIAARKQVLDDSFAFADKLIGVLEFAGDVAHGDVSGAAKKAFGAATWVIGKGSEIHADARLHALNAEISYLDTLIENEVDEEVEAEVEAAISGVSQAGHESEGAIDEFGAASLGVETKVLALEMHEQESGKNGQTFAKLSDATAKSRQLVERPDAPDEGLKGSTMVLIQRLASGVFTELSVRQRAIAQDVGVARLPAADAPSFSAASARMEQFHDAARSQLAYIAALTSWRAIAVAKLQAMSASLGGGNALAQRRRILRDLSSRIDAPRR
jgi:hypothetical protein